MYGTWQEFIAFWYIKEGYTGTFKSDNVHRMICCVVHEQHVGLFVCSFKDLHYVVYMFVIYY